MQDIIFAFNFQTLPIYKSLSTSRYYKIYKASFLESNVEFADYILVALIKASEEAKPSSAAFF